MTMLNNLFLIWLFMTPYFLSPWVKLYGPFPIGSIYFSFFLFLLLSYFYRNRLSAIKDLVWDFLKPPLLFLTLFLIFQIISILFNLYRIPAVSHLINATGFRKPLIHSLTLIGFYIFSFLTIWLISKISTSWDKLKKSLSIWHIASIVPINIGFIFIVVYHFNTFNHEMAIKWVVPRLHGTAAESQVFGNYMLSVIFIGLWFILTSKKSKRIINYLIAAGLFLALTLTWSIGAWAGFVVGLTYSMVILLFLKLIRFKQIISILLMFTFSLGAMYIVFPNYMHEASYAIAYKIIPYKYFSKGKPLKLGKYITKQKMGSLTSQQDRAWLRDAAIKMFKESPLIGVGIGNYAFLYNQYAPPYKDAQRPYLAKAHNQYLEVLAETGIFGFIVFISFLIGMFWLSIITLRQTLDKERKILIVFLQASIIAIYIQGISFGILAHTYVWLLFGFLLASCSWREKQCV